MQKKPFREINDGEVFSYSHNPKILFLKTAADAAVVLVAHFIDGDTLARGTAVSVDASTLVGIPDDAGINQEISLTVLKAAA